MASRWAVAAAAAALVSGCTLYEGYTVTETKSKPARPVEVARAGDLSSFDRIVTSGADIATAIVAPIAAVAKAAVISVVDVEVNREKETRTIRAARWLTNDSSRFPALAERSEGLAGEAGMEPPAASAPAETP